MTGVVVVKQYVDDYRLTINDGLFDEYLEMGKCGIRVDTSLLQLFNLDL